MEEILSSSLKYFIALLSILNPIGALPIFLGMTREFSEKEIKKIATSCAIAVFVTLIISLVIGNRVLDFFGITIASFRIAGGFLIFTMSLSMLSAKNHGAKLSKNEIEEFDPDEIGIVPLAIPLLAGPGAISTSIIKAEQIGKTGEWLGHIIALVILCILVKLILNFSRTLGDRLGTLGLNVMTRIMGLILMALSVEFVANGIKEIFSI